MSDELRRGVNRGTKNGQDGTDGGRKSEVLLLADNLEVVARGIDSRLGDTDSTKENTVRAAAFNIQRQTEELMDFWNSKIKLL